VVHVSFHQLRDTARAVHGQDLQAPFWQLTLDPPLEVENLLPFPLQYKALGRVIDEATGMPAQPTFVAANEGGASGGSAAARGGGIGGGGGGEGSDVDDLSRPLLSPLIASSANLPLKGGKEDKATGGPLLIDLSVDHHHQQQQQQQNQQQNSERFSRHSRYSAGRGQVSQCLAVNPRVASPVHPWSQHISTTTQATQITQTSRGNLVVDQVRLQFCVRKDGSGACGGEGGTGADIRSGGGGDTVECDPADSPAVYGNAHSGSSAPFKSGGVHSSIPTGFPKRFPKRFPTAVKLRGTDLELRVVVESGKPMSGDAADVDHQHLHEGGIAGIVPPGEMASGGIGEGPGAVDLLETGFLDLATNSGKRLVFFWCWCSFFSVSNRAATSRSLLRW